MPHKPNIQRKITLEKIGMKIIVKWYAPLFFKTTPPILPPVVIFMGIKIWGGGSNYALGLAFSS